MNHSLSEEAKIDKFVYVIFWMFFGLQNKELFNVIVLSLGGLRLNIYDAGIMFSMLFLCFRFIFMKSKKINLIDFSLIFLFICFLIVGIVNGNEVSAIFYNARSLGYLIIGYWITKNLNASQNFFFYALGVASFMCSSFYFYNFMKGSDFAYGEIHRSISFNLIIILLYICYSIFYFKHNKIKYMPIINIVYGAVAIFTSQTRTLIVPLIILMIMFFVSLLYSSKIKMKYKIFILIIALLSFYVFMFSNLTEVGFNRFISSESNEESTLDLRIDSMLYNFSTMIGVEWVLGGGFGREILYYSNFNGVLMFNYDLELYIGEYLVKYGVLGTILLNLIYIIIILKSYKDIDKKFMIGIIILLGALNISGLGGYQGQLFFGLVLGIIGNKRVWREETI